MKKNFFGKIIIIFLFSFTYLFAQPKKIMNGAELKLALKKLNVLGTVLYVAAHPDDENTAVLSYFSSGKLMRTGYLSITRGDGGQNLIGTEQAELLGVIRTQELLAARKVDGAEQFFTRAIDFGYTKNDKETFEFWDKDKILSDVVWVIRNFKPDIIITRFPSTGQGGHGQHTASAILAEEAFKIAGDPKAFPEQLKYVDVWQPVRILWNGWPQAFNNAASMPEHLTLNLGEYNPILGKSYTEISAESRTMHKSQGFGSSGRRDETINYFFLTDGDGFSLNYNEGEGDLFENINTSWSRIKGGNEIGKLLSDAERKFNPENPAEILPILFNAYSLMSKIDDEHYVKVKMKELTEVIRSAAGIWMEGISEDYKIFPGFNFNISAGVVNRSDFPFKLKKIVVSNQKEIEFNVDLQEGKFFDSTISFLVPQNINYTIPYWLKEESSAGIFNVDNQLLIGKPENDPPLKVDFVLESNGTEIVFTTPLFYRWTDPVNGEQYRPLEVTPPVTIKSDNKLYIFPEDKEKNLNITLKNHSDQNVGELSLILPDGWKSTPEKINFSFERKNEEKVYTFSVTPPLQASEGTAKVLVKTNSGIFGNEDITINYSHIPVQTFFPELKIKLVKINTEKVVNNIGYIMGSGDDIPEYLEQLDYNVEIINNFNRNNLERFDVIITGIRAYNTNEKLENFQSKLLDYVYKGGTLLIQYNTERGLVTDNIGPFPLSLSRFRVSVENAPVKFLNENHPLLNFPNKITQKDFDNWIQERGLYFPGEWDSKYETIISSADPGENLNEGGNLFAKYGKGVFIYSAYSWFRQLPAGVPGAYRLFVNMISAGHYSDTSN